MLYTQSDTIPTVKWSIFFQILPIHHNCVLAKHPKSWHNWTKCKTGDIFKTKTGMRPFQGVLAKFHLLSQFVFIFGRRWLIILHIFIIDSVLLEPLHLVVNPLLVSRQDVFIFLWNFFCNLHKICSIIKLHEGVVLGGNWQVHAMVQFYHSNFILLKVPYNTNDLFNWLLNIIFQISIVLFQRF